MYEKKVIEKFGNPIVISELNEKHNVNTTGSAVDNILYSFHTRTNKESSKIILFIVLAFVLRI